MNYYTITDAIYSYRAMVLYTNSVERSLPYRSLWHTFALIQLSIILTSMCYAVPESLGDIEEMGRDLAFILGVRIGYILH